MAEAYRKPRNWSVLQSPGGITLMVGSCVKSTLILGEDEIWAGGSYAAGKI